MSAHYIELAPSAFTLLGTGAVVYHAPETTAGGSNAIDFKQSVFAGDGEIFFSIPLKQVPPGTYEWLRISLAYQNFELPFRLDTTVSGVSINRTFTGTLASFVGFNNYIESFKVKNGVISVNGNRKQGFWGFEADFSSLGIPQPITSSGEAPEGSTTVVNPLFQTSPIPQGSCVVTAAFEPGKLVITGKETKDIVIEASFSTNKSFEWVDTYPNGFWEPLKKEKVVDMGLRGLKPRVL
ncbi:hypothetical protein KJS94_16220 [Flavihumibacter rivuli]|uniref:hypothetical protein n=1 Tax=Flavihumibacter rivuli TaxID=2838156 RepID=UPI001DB5CE32|nr:hypothetical protein [Flavihumibacter rivuli]ULQ56196.1 hypothetical protein KJS94_16220 [Flavihumibacter rivuli]